MTIDLSSLGVPELQKPVRFSFLDPVYAWACCAYQTSKKEELHFQFKKHLHPTTGERLYGGSVAHGNFMREACRQVPTEPALMGISYDSGNASKRRSYIPIILSVANTDSRCMDSATCIAYMPDFKLNHTHAHRNSQEAMHRLRQACIGAIVDVIEACGQDGFECLVMEDGTQKKKLLFPVICRMEFDTKERYKFFCCSKQHACGIGSGPRQGHSALRRCTPHSSRADLPAKRRACADETSADFDDATESLKRRGIHPTRQCTALMGRTYSLLEWPGRIHFGLFAYDILHVLYLNCIGYLIDGLLDSMTKTQKRELDRRAQTLLSFRTPEGRSTKRVNNLSITGYLSAEMKVLHLFIWPHALGSRALLLRPELRSDSLIAISTLQTIIYSVRGRRSFTENEHRYVFADLGRRFWRAITNIVHWKRQARILAAQTYNRDRSPTTYHPQHITHSICSTTYHPHHITHSMCSTAYLPQHITHSICSTAYHPHHITHSMCSTAYRPQHTTHSICSTAYPQHMHPTGVHPKEDVFHTGNLLSNCRTRPIPRVVQTQIYLPISLEVKKSFHMPSSIFPIK